MKRNRMTSLRNLIKIVPAVLLAIVLPVACSTTKRLPEGEVLYTGVRQIKITPTDKEQLPDGLVSEIKDALAVDPACPLPFVSPYIANPFPFGLWVYNEIPDSARGFKGWIYRMFAKPPVTVGDVRPEMRLKMVEGLLANNGHFGSSAFVDVDYNKKNPRKARLSYRVDVSKGYPLDSIILFNEPESLLKHYIDSLALREPYLKKGEVFCVDSLSTVRVNIANKLRNRGYYYFEPDYLEFLADTFLNPGNVALKLSLADNIAPMALNRYKVGKVTAVVQHRSRRSSGTPDTIAIPQGDLIIMRPMHIREKMIPECITFRKGRYFSVRNMDWTQARLARLGIFSDIRLQVFPADTSSGHGTLDVMITCKQDRPMEASLEVNATSKSNSYIGPGLVATLSHKNLFGGGEKLNIKLNANYEWQTGRNRSSVFNSYEFGLSATLAFPRLLAPAFIRRTRREINWTNFTLSGDVLNRPHYFMMAEYAMEINYEWRATRNTQHSFTPFKLSYTKMIRTTEEFDAVMAENPSIAQSFQNRFIPQLSYSYTLDKFLERERINGINFTAGFTEAGNLFDVIYRACGVKGEKKLFGTPFSQFIKGQAQIVYNRRLFRGSDQWLVTRFAIGAEHAFGNSREVPYSEQFYVGGANSIRAFTVRSIGPGSYRSPKEAINGYFDQTGTFKIELNAEYRFPIVSVLHGAAFIDSGNVWLLKKDPYRPGGELQGSTFFRDLALGTGVGLRVDIGMMVIRGDLGYGLHTPYGNGTGHYFNVAFKNAFAFHLAIGYPF